METGRLRKMDRVVRQNLSDVTGGGGENLPRFKAFEYLKKIGFSEKLHKSKEVQIIFTKCLYEKGKKEFDF